MIVFLANRGRYHKLFVILLGILAMWPGAGWAAEKVGALGRIQAGNGLIYLTGGSNDIIAEILVQKDDVVQQGTAVAVLQSKALYATEVKLAEVERNSAEKLGQEVITLQTLKIREIEVQGAQAIALQELQVQKTQEDLGIALKRVERLKQVGDTYSSQDIETGEYERETAGLNEAAAKQELERLKSEHATSLDVANRELKRLTLERSINMQRTEQNLALARERLRSATILAPIDGTILEVSRHVGEVVGNQPIMIMADLQNMLVIGEIFESDVLKIAVNMPVTVTSKALPEPLQGHVESIGRVLSLQSKVAEVRIRLDNADIASRLINLEVGISIELQAP